MPSLRFTLKHFGVRADHYTEGYKRPFMGSVASTNSGLSDLLQTLSNDNSPLLSTLTSPAVEAALEKAPPGRYRPDLQRGTTTPDRGCDLRGCGHVHIGLERKHLSGFTGRTTGGLPKQFADPGRADAVGYQPVHNHAQLPVRRVRIELAARAISPAPDSPSAEYRSPPRAS
jgi:hypothetical protein